MLGFRTLMHSQSSTANSFIPGWWCYCEVDIATLGLPHFLSIPWFLSWCSFITSPKKWNQENYWAQTVFFCLGKQSFLVFQHKHRKLSLYSCDHLCIALEKKIKSSSLKLILSFIKFFQNLKKPEFFITMTYYCSIIIGHKTLTLKWLYYVLRVWNTSYRVCEKVSGGKTKSFIYMAE